MIDCLSNPSWINPQIDFLLFLQNIRIGHFDFFDKFFLSITVFGEFWLPTLICAITYWCIDMKSGMYLLSLAGFNSLIIHFFKMIACVYRPWVLSDKIHPSELAVPFAKGYSFPSGHSAMSSSVLGGTAYLLRQKRSICVLLICLILLIGFSRLWLGVHTPQDVVCGLLIGAVLLFAASKIIDFAEQKSSRYLLLMFIVNVLAIFALTYVCCFGAYRMDYIYGELLVNPSKQIYVMIVVYGYNLGLLNGCFLCRKLFPFNPKDVSVRNRILRGVIGGIFIVFGQKYIISYVIMNELVLKFAVPIMLITGLFITFIYPIIFQSLDKQFGLIRTK